MRSVAEQKAANEAKYRRDSERILKVDEWWLVVDAGFAMAPEQSETLREAMRLAESSGISMLVDSPSFEYWVLLHACYASQRFGDVDELLEYIEGQFAELGCEIVPSSLLKRLGNAMVNAATMDDRSIQSLL